MAIKAWPDDRYIRMESRYDSRCRECNGEIMEGDLIIYDTREKKAYCTECGKEFTS